MIVKQILLVSTRGNVKVTVLRQYMLQGVKLRLIQAPMRLNFLLWRPNPEN